MSTYVARQFGRRAVFPAKLSSAAMLASAELGRLAVCLRLVECLLLLVPASLHLSADDLAAYSRRFS